MRWSWLSPLILAVFFPSIAFADGGHREAASAGGAIPAVSIDGYRVELLTSPAPMRAGSETRIIAKVHAEDGGSPLRGGEVRIGLEAVRSGTEADALPRGVPGLVAAPEETWAGSYTARLTPREEGPHLVRVAIAELAGRRFEPAAAITFRVAVAPAGTFGWGFVVVSVIMLSTGVAGVWAVAARTRYGAGDSRLDLLEIPWLRRVLLSPALQPSLQVPLLILMVVVTVLGFMDTQDGDKNLATRLVWSLWWPGIVITFILVGRLWCVMCPFGVLNEWPSRLVKPTRLVPKAMRNLWPATGLFVLLTLADEQLGVFDSPRATAWTIVLFGALALGMGVLYQRRSFCRYVCPIGGMIGIYSMLAPVGLRPKSGTLCRNDCSKDCYRGNDAGRGCPMFEFPLAMDRNMYCNLCFDCVKACRRENLSLTVRAFGADLWGSARRSLDESYFTMALVGITTLVTAQMLGAWDPFISWLAGFLGPIRGWLKPVTYLTLTESAVFLIGSLVLFPLLLLLAARVAARRGGEGVRGTFLLFSTMFIPIALGMHLAHNVPHLFNEGPGIVPAVQRFFTTFTVWSLGEPVWDVAPLLDAATIYSIQVTLLFLSFAFSVKVGQRLALNGSGEAVDAGRMLVPMVALALLFTLLNVYVLGLPMGPRHGA